MNKKVEKFIAEYNIKTDYKTRYIDLVSEVGELGKELLLSDNYNKEKFNITNNTIYEIGDCLFSLIALCNELNIDHNEALKCSLEKYKKRFEVKGE